MDKKYSCNLPYMLKELPHMEYKKYTKALGIVKDMAETHKMLRIIGYPGSGKTTLLLETYASTQNSIYVVATKGCGIKDLLAMLTAPMGFVPGTRATTKTQCIFNTIAFLKGYGEDVVFLIDEADHLCSSQKRLDNIDTLDALRQIWDATRNVSFIFAAPHEFEARIQTSDEFVSNSQFYRRCFALYPEGMTEDDIHEYLTTIEKEFHVVFDRGAHALLVRRIAATERAGLGITAEIIKIAFKIVPYWQEYSRMLDHDVPREQALKIFDNNKTVTISQKLIEEAMTMKR